MKLKENFMLRQVAGSYVVAVPDEQRDALEGFFAKEPSATWERLDGGER